mmetsp:Transcript_62946/g.101807  ORF Transcript_62946/g.101807 Transcript_62946/m.101807 type:complete len:131 (-) Transcript_62946:913-1305(-)
MSQFLFLYQTMVERGVGCRCEFIYWKCSDLTWKFVLLSESTTKQKSKLCEYIQVLFGTTTIGRFARTCGSDTQRTKVAWRHQDKSKPPGKKYCITPIVSVVFPPITGLFRFISVMARDRFGALRLAAARP